MENMEKTLFTNFLVRGKTVLDVGAGCDETAFFYLVYGAKKLWQ
jgi:predicted RNA methylase